VRGEEKRGWERGGRCKYKGGRSRKRKGKGERKGKDK